MAFGVETMSMESEAKAASQAGRLSRLYDGGSGWEVVKGRTIEGQPC
jgi:hypothetical protein